MDRITSRRLRDESEKRKPRGIGCGRILVLPLSVRKGEPAMNRILVWDVPTRVLHWLLTGTLIAALSIALKVDDDSSVFQLHMLFGLIAAFVVVLRLVW
jgi:hypothetical protein